MRWIALAIIVSLGLYTFLNLHYRKAEPGFRPYEDIAKRATVARLLDAGWQRIPVSSRRPADPLSPAEKPPETARIEPSLPGLPPQLAEMILEKTALAGSIERVIAAPETSTANHYPVYFECTLTDQKSQILDVELYVKGENAVLVPRFEKIAQELTARNKATEVWLDIPTQALKPGHYRIALVGKGSSKAWNLAVK